MAATVADERSDMASWFAGGDNHTGWKDANGTPVTDKRAKEIVAEADKKYAAATKAALATRKGK